MTRSILVAMLVLAGCAERTEAVGGCEDTVTELPVDETTPLGFSGDDLLAVAEGTHLATGAWTDDGIQTDVQLVVAAREGLVRFHDLEPADSDGPEPALLCEDYVEVPVSLSLSTRDGGFDEAADDVVTATELATPFVGWRIEEPSEIGGTYTVSGIDPAEWDDLDLVIDAEVGDAFSGAVGLHAERTEGDLAEAMYHAVLEWPAE